MAPFYRVDRAPMGIKTPHRDPESIVLRQTDRALILRKVQSLLALKGYLLGERVFGL